MPQLWNGKLLLFSRDNAEKTKGAFANSYMYEHNFSSARWMLNEKCFLLMLRCRQRCLGSLCLAVFIYCQAEVDLQFSLYQILSQHPQSRRTREKPDWRGAWEENQHIWVWLKPSKRSPSARPFFFLPFFAIQPIVPMSSTWKKIFYIFAGMCYLCFSGTWGFVEPPRNEVRACSSCQAACSIEILPPLMRSRGKTNF